MNTLDRIRELKTRVKNRRDRGQYERANSIILEAIGLAEDSLNHTDLPELRSQYASELADCFGLQGGIQRRWAMEADLPQAQRTEHLRESVLAYDKGYRIESDKGFGLVNSYNMLNRVLSRLLYDRETFLGAGDPLLQEGIKSLDVQSELQKAKESIRAQIASQRRGDYWALADLAMVTLLLGQKDAGSAYAAFDAESPPDFAYESALSVLKPLAQLPLPDAKVAKELSLGVKHLEKRLELRKR